MSTPSSGEPILIVDGLTVVFRASSADKPVVNAVAFQVLAGEVVTGSNLVFC